MKQLLIGILLAELVKLCSLTLFPFGDGSIKDVYLPNKWNTIADCPVRYYDVGYSSYAAPVFGTEAFEKEFAHMAAIGWTESDGKITWNCGGSLISENFVLTAAHCGFWKGKNPDVIRMGDLNLERDDDDKYAQQLSIAEIIYHPEYTAKYRYHDLALLKLNQSVVVHPTVCPICLWVNSTVKFKSVEACGYGQTGLFDEKTPKLLKVTLSPVNKTQCSEHYPPDRKLNLGLTDQQICAVDPEFKQDTCLGDSGGPLQIKLLGFGRINPFLIGVTSFGKSCGTETPGVYAKISSYIDWLEQVTGQNFDPLICAHKYFEHRDYEPDIITSKKDDGSFEYIDSTKLHFEANPNRHEHRATIMPGGCSGTFIHEEYVLTSAACLARTSAKPELVTSNGGVVQAFGIRKAILHYNFNPENFDNDIALVQLTQMIKFEEDIVVPGCLWTKNLPNEELEVTGLGPAGAQQLFVSSNVEKLFNGTDYLAARSNKIPIADCKRFYKQEEDISITDNSICYGNTSWYILPDSCALDLGGPLGRKYFGAGSKFLNYVMGINSYGNDCGFGFPAVATKVSQYTAWIDSIIFTEPLVRGDACTSPIGSGMCVPSSECAVVVERVKRGDALNPFVCNFNDHHDPLVCCPRSKTALDECPELYRQFRKEPQQDRSKNQVWSHVAMLNEETNCYGSLISEQLVLTSTRCANSKTELPLTLKIGDPQCNPVTVEAVSIDELTSTTSMLRLRQLLSFSDCISPICLWTDETKIPFEMAALPITTYPIVAYPPEKCQMVINETSTDDHLGCALLEYFSECESPTPEPLQAIRNESNLVIPYLVGIGTRKGECVESGKMLYFEKINTITDKILSFFVK